MNWMVNLLRSGKQLIIKHAPGILMGMGTVGLGTSVILAIKAGPRAVILTEKAERQKAEEENGDPNLLMIELTQKEKFETLYPLYIPPVGMALFSLICFWAAHGIDLKRQAVVAGLYSAAEATLNEYQKKVVEMLGENQAAEIRQSLGDDRVAQAQRNLPPPPEDFDLGSQKWCYLYGRRFPSSYNRIKDVQNEINNQMINEVYASESDLFWKLDPTGEWLKSDNQAQMCGWNSDRMLVLRVDNPGSPSLNVTYEDKYGQSYMPEPNFSRSL